ncbi:MAG TPA: CBS domain-containing protein [Polyangiaceae bacterium]|nr:CBS domain-containing protein [Polyangiaceae bacterium]
MIVRDVMTPAPHVAEVNEKLRSIHAKFLELDVRHLPVVDGGKLVGIISERDLPSDLITPAARNGSDRADRIVSHYMSADVISVNPESDLGEAIDLMLEHRIGALPVVDVDGERLIGILSYVDVLREARRLL